MLGTPVEVVETLAPLLVERKGLRDGSGGDGCFRGGLGQALAFRVLTDDPATCSVFCDRTRIPPQGFFGGEPGARGALLINGEAPENPKAEQPIQPGALIELLMPGGGGYGPPAERDPALRERDHLEGYVASANEV